MRQVGKTGKTQVGRLIAMFLIGALAAVPALAVNESDPTLADGCATETQASPFIPVDSWVYPAMVRLVGMGYVHTAFLGMRPWTRASVAAMLEEARGNLQEAEMAGDRSAVDAQQIHDAVAREIGYVRRSDCIEDNDRKLRVESAYSVVRGMTGTPLRDSFHLGSTVVNDYGRPYENGLNGYSGLSGYATAGRFLLYARGEFVGASSGTGYTNGLATTLAGIDWIPATHLMTIPQGPLGTTTEGRVLEAYVAVKAVGHTISFGREDEWMGPAEGGSWAYSNNAENVWALHIDRTEPLEVPGLSRIFGPFRYEFLVGPLKGHNYVPPTKTLWVTPGAPWAHVEKVSLQPTPNFEVGFERTVIWGGKGHEPITLHTFLRSFFSVNAPNDKVKNSNRDPGARFSSFDFRYRLPRVRNWLTLYADSEAHDDVFPVSAPRRAAFRTGLYLTQVPGLRRLDARVEAASSDPSTSRSTGGHFMYWEGIQKQGYTNAGELFGDWMGREAKGGQGWLTWRLSGQEWIQASYRRQKAAKDFIPGGTTLEDFSAQVVKRLRRDLEIDGRFTLEHWKSPAYPGGTAAYPAPGHTVTATTVRVTWYPDRKISF